MAGAASQFEFRPSLPLRAFDFISRPLDFHALYPSHRPVPFASTTARAFSLIRLRIYRFFSWQTSVCLGDRELRPLTICRARVLAQIRSRGRPRRKAASNALAAIDVPEFEGAIWNFADVRPAVVCPVCLVAPRHGLPRWRVGRRSALSFVRSSRSLRLHTWQVAALIALTTWPLANGAYQGCTQHRPLNLRRDLPVAAAQRASLFRCGRRSPNCRPLRLSLYRNAPPLCAQLPFGGCLYGLYQPNAGRAGNGAGNLRVAFPGWAEVVSRTADDALLHGGARSAPDTHW